jgi:hypothetical protein
MRFSGSLAAAPRLEPVLGVIALAAMAALLLHYGIPQLAVHVLNGGHLAAWMRTAAFWASLRLTRF